MDQLACTAGCQGSLVATWRGLDVEEVRELVRRSVRGRANGSFEFVVASYDRRSLGQTGSGHFSPLAALDEVSDSVLVLDVARFKVRLSNIYSVGGSDFHLDSDGRKGIHSALIAEHLKNLLNCVVYVLFVVRPTLGPTKRSCRSNQTHR